MQPDLFTDFPLTESSLPHAIGGAKVTVRQARAILTKASGFISEFDFTLNPYIGCTFGCAYCYAAFFVPDTQKSEEWGRWVEVKENALELLKRSRSLAGSTVYLGSVTDGYQPVESKIRLTRSLLEYMVSMNEQPRIVIQTRSPLVLNDIDILQEFKHLRVNVSVTTDCDNVRRAIEPMCSSISRRIETLRFLKEAGIKTGVCVTPMLPIRDPSDFAVTLRDLNADVYVTQPFHATKGRFSAGTRDTALKMADDYQWTGTDYQRVVDILSRAIPNLCEGKEGFMPE